ncbi:hypothetical protein [Mycoplasma sp. 005V]|uniref:hypothetical protein n=1 Tax=unclassified Mycoplasma TaxID=2683645 RepID=UPI003A885E11
MKLKGILLTISGLTLAAAPAIAISCQKPEDQDSGNQTQNNPKPEPDTTNNETLKTELNKTINAINNLDIKNKSQYTADQLATMDKAELAKLVSIPGTNFDETKYGITVVKAEKKLNEEATAYDLDLTIQIYSKENNQVISFTRKFQNLSGFNIAIEDVNTLISNKYINDFARSITLDVANKENIFAKDVEKNQVTITIPEQAAHKDLFNVAVESLRPKAINTTLEVTLLVSSKKSATQQTVTVDITGFKNDETTLANEELKTSLAANIKDIKLSVNDTKLLPSQVGRENIIASNYDEKNFTFAILEDVVTGENTPEATVEYALQPQFKLDPFTFAKLGLKVKFKLTAKSNPEITATSVYDINKGFPSISRSIFQTPKDSTVDSNPTPPESARDIKYLQLQYKKKQSDKNLVTGFIKKDLEPINEKDPYKDLKYKYKDLRQKILDNLFVKSSDGSGSLMIVPNLPTAQRTFLTWILFTIDRQYYAPKPKAELYQLFNAPLGKDALTQNTTYNVDHIIDIAKKTATNANV